MPIIAGLFRGCGAVACDETSALCALPPPAHCGSRVAMGRTRSSRSPPPDATSAVEFQPKPSHTKPMTNAHDVICIGAGPTGLACAIEAKRAGIDLACHRQRLPLQLALSLPDEHEFLHHARTHGDRRHSHDHLRRQAHADRGVEVLPPRRLNITALTCASMSASSASMVRTAISSCTPERFRRSSVSRQENRDRHRLLRLCRTR